MPLQLFYNSIYAATFLLFFTILLLAKRKRALRIFDQGNLVYSPLLLLLHVAGILLFGFCPLFFSHTQFPVFFRAKTLLWQPFLLSIIVLGLVLLAAFRLATKEYKTMVQYDKAIPPLTYLTAYLFLRFLFIIAYETWFRGFLLIDSIALLGIPLAFGLNVLLYTLLHAVNDRREMLGCVPFGLLLCSLCTWLGQVWPAVIIHLALTLTYEITLLYKRKLFPYANFYYRRFRLHRS